MKHNGFQNAPGVKEFKAGMRIKLPQYVIHGGESATVRWVEPRGGAYCETDDHDAVFCVAVNIPDCILDLDSIWEGREYEHTYGAKSCVAFVSDSHVANCLGGLYVRKTFLADWKPIPLPAAEVEAPADEHEPLAEILQRLREVRDGATLYQMKPAEAFGDIIEALEVVAAQRQKETPQ